MSADCKHYTGDRYHLYLNSKTCEIGVAMFLVLCPHPHGPFLISALASGDSSVQADSISPQGLCRSPCLSAPELPLLKSSLNP